MRLVFLIAAYNEAEIVGTVISRIRERYPDHSILVVDDCSSDSTVAKARASGAEVLSHRVNLGQGAALQTGFECLIRMGYTDHDDFIVTFDADGQHSLEDVEPSMAMLNSRHCDIAFGSRFLGSTEGMPLLRNLVVRLGIVYNWLSTGLLMTDAHNGFRIIRGGALPKIRINCNRMAHASEFLNVVRTQRIPFCEVACRIVYSDYSKAKGQSIKNMFSIIGNHLLYLVFRV
jgi:polyprenyl-phospho-N-acetylgalactosaminyl synthase